MTCAKVLDSQKHTTLLIKQAYGSSAPKVHTVTPITPEIKNATKTLIYRFLSSYTIELFKIYLIAPISYRLKKS